MNITRKRFIVMRNNRSEVWCGLSKNFYFKPISEIKDTPIKTYRSQAQAKAGCSSWDRNFEVVPVIETIEQAVIRSGTPKQGDAINWSSLQFVATNATREARQSLCTQGGMIGLSRL